MNEAQRELWGRIQAFEFDAPGVELTFAQRLARETGWSVATAERAIEEYRRFLLLAVTAGHPVTPSDEVDRVWHLHLVYTRSYWEDLCPNVLGSPLHHGPTAGGDAEDAKYNDWYTRTKESYAEVFGGAPPPDLWPSNSVRFGARGGARHPHPAVVAIHMVGVALVGLAVLGGLAVFVASQSGMSATWAVDVAGACGGMAMFGVLLFVVGTLVDPVRGNRRGSDRSGGCGTGHDPWWGSHGCGSSGCGGGGCGGGGCGGD